MKFWGGGGLHSTEEAYLLPTMLASHPAAPGSNPGSAEIFLSENFSLYCLVPGQY